MKSRLVPVLCALLFLPFWAEAAPIRELFDSSWSEQFVSFWKMESGIVRNAVVGTLLIGILCGLLGSFLVTRKMALFGDMLAHAILPGVALGFLWNQTKDPVAIFIGASSIGLLGAILTHTIRNTTRLKEDGVLALILAGFYGVGILLISIIQNQGYGTQSGIDKYMFGQAAALSSTDIKLLAIITILSLVLVFVFYKELLATSFDLAFAKTTGMPVRTIQYGLMTMLSFAIVVSLQATGVVIVAALLILPAASAYLLTDRMHILILLACLVGAASGFFGAFISYLQPGLPTGPFMVVNAAGFFLLAFLLSPRYGVVALCRRRLKANRTIRLENALKGAYLTLESEKAKGMLPTDEDTVPIIKYANERNIERKQAHHEVNMLVNKRLAIVVQRETGQPDDLLFRFTIEGLERAAELVRAHRLWELYLTEAAAFEADTVHPDAERIEHILGRETIKALEARLNNPSYDPHGRSIPTSGSEKEGQ